MHKHYMLNLLREIRKSQINNLQRQLFGSLSESKKDFEELGIKSDDVLTLSINTDLIEQIIKEVGDKRKIIKEKLDTQNNNSLAFNLNNISTEIKDLQNQLSAPQRAYQIYIQQLKEWNVVKEKIQGDNIEDGSINYLDNRIKEINNYPKELRCLEKDRYRKARDILKEKWKLRNYYQTYFGAVQDFLKKHHLVSDVNFGLNFEVSINQEGFSETFLNKINQRKTGPFAGTEEGIAEISNLLSSTNWDCKIASLKFARNLLERMKTHDGKELEIKDQLKQKEPIETLYDFIFSFKYLSPIYRLTWDGKGLEQLSPGERGNLLLIFYLLVDLDDRPLVIDQPEENLDNQTVFKILVPCIKDAKKRRQLIMVTHNPNLAVVCDAEQIIYAEIKKDDNNKVVYKSGSIENQFINKLIVDVLEGTRPAFDKRDSKYLQI